MNAKQWPKEQPVIEKSKPKILMFYLLTYLYRLTIFCSTLRQRKPPGNDEYFNFENLHQADLGNGHLLKCEVSAETHKEPFEDFLAKFMVPEMIPVWDIAHNNSHKNLLALQSPKACAPQKNLK